MQRLYDRPKLPRSCGKPICTRRDEAQAATGSVIGQFNVRFFIVIQIKRCVSNISTPADSRTTSLERSAKDMREGRREDFQVEPAFMCLSALHDGHLGVY